MIQSATWTWIPRWQPTPLPPIFFQNLVSLSVSHVTLQSSTTQSLLCHLLFSHGSIYLTFFFCVYKKVLVGRSWRWHGAVSHTKTGDLCISNAHLNLLSLFFGLCIVSVYGTASVLSYGDVRLLLLCKNDFVSLSTHFHKSDNKHIVITSRQCALCLKELYRVCVPVLNTMEKCSGAAESCLSHLP